MNSCESASGKTSDRNEHSFLRPCVPAPCDDDDDDGVQPIPPDSPVASIKGQKTLSAVIADRDGVQWMMNFLLLYNSDGPGNPKPKGSAEACLLDAVVKPKVIYLYAVLRHVVVVA